MLLITYRTPCASVLKQGRTLMVAMTAFEEDAALKVIRHLRRLPTAITLSLYTNERLSNITLTHVFKNIYFYINFRACVTSCGVSS